MAKKYHPDRNKDDKSAEQKFKEINNAYDTLKDPQKRRVYDQFGEEGLNGGGGFGRGGGAGAGQGGFGGAFSDIFEDLFGGGFGGGFARSQASNNAGSDLRYNLQISLEEAFSGITKEISVRKYATCGTCKGSGSEKDEKPTTCPTCNGRGTVRMQQGFFVVEQTCGTCKGSGKIIKNPCKTCHGEGRVQKQKNLSVKIPAGIDEGTRIRLRGEGEAGIRGGQAGDLYIFASIKPHPFYKRKGVDLFAEVPIKVTTATLGGSVEVPTIDGKTAKVTIPAGTAGGAKFRLKGKGMPHMGRGASIYGDMFITVNLKVPKKLSKRQKELLQEFAEIEHSKKETSENGFFGKVKDFFEGLKSE